MIVSFPMFSVVAELSALESAVREPTLIRFFACVPAHVRFQIEFEAEPFAADFTDERLFSGVSEHVSFEFRLVLALLPAYLTGQVCIPNYIVRVYLKLVRLVIS